MALNNPPSLVQKKSLGQVFLKVDWPTDRMVERLMELGIKSVLEIGPGPGNFTRGLLGAGMAVTSIEKDFRFAGILADQAKTFNASPGASLAVVNADILQFDLDQWIKETPGPKAIVGNIPYNISSPILLKSLARLPEISAILFMTQLEFAKRLGAKVSTKDYGSLSVYAQLRANISVEFEVDRTLFKPVPKVDSAVFLVTPLKTKLPDDILKSTEILCRVAFSQRRKMLRNSIKAFLDANPDLENCPINLDLRADAITPEEFVALARWLSPSKET